MGRIESDKQPREIPKHDTQPKGKQEHEPISGWILEFDKRLLEMRHIGKDGKEFVTTDTELTTDESPAIFTDWIFPGDAKIEMTPFQHKIFSKEVNIHTKRGDIRKFFVGVIDNKWISFIATETKSTISEYRTIKQFYFDKTGKASGFHSGVYSGPNWPSQEPHELNADMYDHFYDLVSSISEEAEESLKKAVIKLS